MGNQRTPRISAGVRSQGCPAVLPFTTMNLVPLAGTALSYLCQLTVEKKKKRDLISYGCFPAVIQLEKPCLHKINPVKNTVFGGLDKMPVLAVILLGPLPVGDGNAGLCWPCAHTTAPDLLLQCRNESEKRNKLWPWPDWMSLSRGEGRWCHCRYREL